MKINIGCGKNILPGYTNIDAFVEQDGVLSGTATNIPVPDNSVDEALAEHVFEHLSFIEEKTAWEEVQRVLKKGGHFIIEVPDFEWVCETFLAAQDDFKSHYEVGAIDHYFGNGFDLNQRWSILTTMFFGNQNGEGQFHKTAYTEAKITAIGKMMNMSVVDTKKYDNKGGQALRMTLRYDG